jgi:hypothetical protein
MPSYTLAGATLALLSLVPNVLGDCESFGIDFTSGGTFFQNSNSSDPFTAIQEFKGCQNDNAHNVFVDPTGDQTECSETPMQPDDTPQIITCDQWTKDRLYDGAWSLLIIANNGQDDPIAYQRDFSLEVGEQQTSTIRPTVTVHDKQTPVVNITSTAFETITQTAAASTITSGRGTQTITPKPTTITNTRGFITVTQRTQTWDVIASTTTVPASCSIKPTRHVRDPIASIVPYVLGDDLQNVVENIINGGSPKSLIGGIISSVFHPFGKSRFNSAFQFKRELAAGRSPSEELKQAFVAERAANLKRQAALEKRSPDDRTKTVTDDHPFTSTISEVGSATTQTITTTQQTTITSTPPAVTAGPITVTGKQQTRTRNINIPVVVTTKTQTFTTTIVNTATTTSSGAAETCASQGGVLVD